MIQISNGIATIQSMEKRGVCYHVHYSSMLKRWICDCPDFRHRRMDSGEDCKHITKLLYYLEIASKEESEKMGYDNDATCNSTAPDAVQKIGRSARYNILAEEHKAGSSRLHK